MLARQRDAKQELLASYLLSWQPWCWVGWLVGWLVLRAVGFSDSRGECRLNPAPPLIYIPFVAVAAAVTEPPSPACS